MGAVFFAAIVFAGFLAALRAAGFVPAAFFFAETNRRFSFVEARDPDFADATRLIDAVPANFSGGRFRAGVAFFRGAFTVDFVPRLCVVLAAERTACRLG
jgi:hypothetical protein